MTKLVCVHSYRGGTGKSNIVANLAVLLAQRGRRVGIIDTDIRSPGIHALFGLERAEIHASLNDYLWGKCLIEQAALDVTPSVASPGPGGAVFLVPCSMRAGEIARILKEGYAVERLNDGMQILSEALDLDILLIDTHPGVNEETLLSIAISDSVLFVLRPDHQDYQGTAVTLELAHRLEVSQLLLVVNKVLETTDQDGLAEKIVTAFQTPVAAVLPLTEDLVRLGSGGVLASLRPEADYVRRLHAVVGLIDDDAARPNSVA